MLIAITGNIASGKSEAEKIFRDEGFDVYDTDIIAHKILENSDRVKESFGTTDRKELAKIVFEDSEKMRILESIIHPLVKEEVLKIKSGIISVPQLFEAGFESLFDKIIFVSAPEELRLERLMKRNNLSKEEAQIRIDAQMSEEEKISKCDFIIDNSSTPENLRKQIENILIFIR